MSGRDRVRVVRLGGHPVRIADEQPTFWDRVECGTWEPGTLAVLSGCLGPGATFLDLGAWVGPLTLLAAARGARVVAVEADPAALDGLGRNLGANPVLASRVTVLPRAVSAEGGSATFGARRKPGDSMSSRLLAAGAGRTWEARCVTPADLAARLGDGPLVVKLDIEGGEYDLLPAMRPLLADPDTVVLVSFHPGILAETGETDPVGRTERALAMFRGWAAFAVEEAGAVSRPLDAEALARTGDAYPDTWLFSRRRPGPGGVPGRPA